MFLDVFIVLLPLSIARTYIFLTSLHVKCPPAPAPYNLRTTQRCPTSLTFQLNANVRVLHRYGGRYIRLEYEIYVHRDGFCMLVRSYPLCPLCSVRDQNPLPPRLLGVVLCQAGWYLVHFGNDKRFLKTWVREPLHKYSHRF